MPLSSFFRPRIFPGAEQLKCSACLASRLHRLDCGIAADREAAKSPIEPVERAPALGAIGRDTEGEPWKGSIEVLDAAMRGRLRPLDEKVGEFLGRHGRAPAG